MNHKDRVLHPELRLAATQGDKLYNEFVLKHLPSSLRVSTLGVVKSNNFIQHFHCGFKYKWNGKNGSRTTEKIKGDYVEAWMWFIHQTFGPEAFRRYVHTQIKNVLLKYEQGKIEL